MQFQQTCTKHVARMRPGSASFTARPSSAMRPYIPGERLISRRDKDSGCSDDVPDHFESSVKESGLRESLKATSLATKGLVSSVLLGLSAGAAFAAEAPLDLRVAGTTFEPNPTVEWEIWFGFIVGLSPFVIAAYEFGKRIVIQRQCAVCKGSGLVQKGRFKRKCPGCGGFLPWESWELFLSSEAGNGGVVRPPKGQRSVIYDVAAAVDASEKVKAALDREAAKEAERAGAVESDSDDKATKKATQE